MKELLFNNWNAMRIFRLAFSVFLFVQAYNTHEWFFIIFGLFFFIQALFNSGCGSNGCAIPKNKKRKK
ncbi:hypothetical protein [Flavobacterium aestuarii]|uniref:hypothetical protein n=1 Tax=Flavobacterium aestuarii TaxID=3149227 RepID=UPI0032B53A5A